MLQTKKDKHEKKAEQEENTFPKSRELEDEIATIVKTEDSQYVTCCAIGCMNTSESMVMTSLPQDPELRLQWVNNIGNEGCTQADDSALCQIHFEQEMWEVSSEGEEDRLKPHAVPTLFLHGQTITSSGTTSNTCNMDNELSRSGTDILAVEPEEFMDTEQHAVYIKEEPLSYEMDEDRDNSNEAPHETPAEDQKPFGHIYLDSNSLQVDGKEANTELSSNFPIKHLNWNEIGTINPEICPVKELVETGANNRGASRKGCTKCSKVWRCSSVMCRAIFDSKRKMDEHFKRKHLTNDLQQVKKRSGQWIAPKLLVAPLNDPQTNSETSKKKFLLLIPETPQSGGVRPESLGKVLLKSPQLDTPECSAQPPKLPEFPKLVSTFQLPSPAQSSPDPPPLSLLTSSEESTMNQLTVPGAPSDGFFISLAQFSAYKRTALKRKIIGFVDAVAKHNLDPNKFIFAYNNKA